MPSVALLLQHDRADVHRVLCPLLFLFFLLVFLYLATLLSDFAFVALPNWLFVSFLVNVAAFSRFVLVLVRVVVFPFQAFGSFRAILCSLSVVTFSPTRWRWFRLHRVYGLPACPFVYFRRFSAPQRLFAGPPEEEIPLICISQGQNFLVRTIGERIAGKIPDLLRQIIFRLFIHTQKHPICGLFLFFGAD